MFSRVERICVQSRFLLDPKGFLNGAFASSLYISFSFPERGLVCILDRVAVDQGPEVFDHFVACAFPANGTPGSRVSDDYNHLLFSSPS